MDTLISVIVAVGGVIAAYFFGRRASAKAAKAEQAEVYRKTTEELDHAETDVGADPAAVRDWLRQRGKP